MTQLLQAGIPVASSCGGDGICGKCLVEVTPTDALSETTPVEQETLKKIQAPAFHRLSCQLRCRGDVQVKTTYW